MATTKLKCGCEFESYLDTNGKICSMKVPLDIEDINLECQKTWDLICSGNTVGVFQLESHLGRTLSAEFKPRNIEELAALISIMRPSCLDSKLEDGKSLTHHFIMRKHGQESVEYIHPKLEPILKNTYSILVYQEQSIEIGQKIGGMNLADSDYYIRKCISEGSVLLTQYGPRYIEDMVGNQQFKTLCDGEWKNIQEIFYSGVKDVYRVKCKSGNYIDLSEDHKVDTEIGWVAVKDLKDNYLKLQGYLDADYKFSKIISVEKIGPKNVYDFTMEDENKPYAYINNIKVHNCIGKKDANLLAESKRIFIEGGKGLGFKKKELEHIFSWIEASVRYQFNKSHAIAYAIDGYKTAYLKYHFPRAFFTARLSNAKDKKEIGHFIKDAKKNNVEVIKPDIRNRNKDFKLVDKKIIFGLSKVKDVGDSNFNKISNIEIPETWIKFLCVSGSKINKTCLSSLIKAGAIDFYKETRNRMLFEHRQYLRLNDSQIKFLEKLSLPTLEDCLLHIIEIGYGKGKPCFNQSVLSNTIKIYELLKTPNVPLKDSINQIVEMEKDYLGYPLTYDELECCDTSSANMTCADVALSKKKNNITICVVINDVKEIITKNSKEKMGFLRVSDDTSSIDSVVIFPEEWKNHNSKLFQGNTVSINCYRKDNSLIAKDIWQI